MARLLFAKGVRGEIVRKLQRRLTDLGFDPKGVDGDFGDATREAVQVFRASIGLEATGTIDVPTWQQLMGVPIPSVAERSLQLTAAFEGHGFTLARGNWDGAGVTWGIIGFTLKFGSLSAILREIHRRDPELLRQAFGNKTAELLQVLRAPRAEQLAWADSISVPPRKIHLAQPWRSAFKRLGEIEEAQAVQLERAISGYYVPALRTASELELQTELGVALCFDIHVQNGSVKPSARAQITRELEEHPVLASEQELRVIVANAVADHGRPPFQEDVRARKLTIATGAGKVHGRTYLVRNWGLAEIRLPAGAFAAVDV